MDKIKKYGIEFDSNLDLIAYTCAHDIACIEHYITSNVMIKLYLKIKKIIDLEIKKQKNIKSKLQRWFK